MILVPQPSGSGPGVLKTEPGEDELFHTSASYQCLEVDCRDSQQTVHFSLVLTSSVPAHVFCHQTVPRAACAERSCLLEHFLVASGLMALPESLHLSPCLQEVYRYVMALAQWKASAWNLHVGIYDRMTTWQNVAIVVPSPIICFLWLIDNNGCNGKLVMMLITYLVMPAVKVVCCVWAWYGTCFNYLLFVFGVTALWRGNQSVLFSS